jgi:hypothetical protein
MTLAWFDYEPRVGLWKSRLQVCLNKILSTYMPVMRTQLVSYLTSVASRHYNISRGWRVLFSDALFVRTAPNSVGFMMLVQSTITKHGIVAWRSSNRSASVNPFIRTQPLYGCSAILQVDFFDGAESLVAFDGISMDAEE